MKNALVRLEPILEIVRAAIWTGKLTDAKPISILLIAQQESAKTEVMKYFRGTSTLRYFSDLTGNGIMHYKKDIESGTLRHFMLNDLVRILSHSKGVGERTLQTLATLMEEGESESANPREVATWAKWPRVGVIMGITPQFYKSKRGGWRASGFMTRFLPVRFYYRDETADLIHAHIANGKTLPEPAPIKLPEKSVSIKISGQLALILQEKGKELGKIHNTYGFRYHKALRALAMGRAAANDRNYVNADDVRAVVGWAKFFTEESEILL